MEKVEFNFTCAALALLLTSGLWVVVSYRKSKTFWAALAAAFGIFALRWLLVEPTFVHASLHGPRLIDQPYDNPYETFRGYGPLAPLIHGLIMRHVGPDLTNIAFLHQLCMSLSLVPLAWLSGRLAKSRTAMIGAFLIAALHPVLMRIGASEDGHALATLMAWIGLAGLYDYAESGRKSRLLLGTAALILMLHTRQIMLVILPFAFLLAFVKGPRERVRSPLFLGAVLLCGALILLRLSVLGTNPDQAFHLRSIAVRFSSVGIVIGTFLHHPLFDVFLYQPFFVPLWLIGAIAAWRSSNVGRTFVLFFAAMFISTLWLYEGRNVALMFRMPLLTVASALGGIGFAQLFAQLERRFDRPWAIRMAAGCGALMVGLPFVLPGFAIVKTLRPLLHEYRKIQATTPFLPKRMVLVANRSGGIDRPGYQFPMHILRGAGIAVDEYTPDEVIQRDKLGERLFFFRGVACYAYSPIELSHLPALDFATIIKAVGEPAANHEIPKNISIPSEMREECTILLQGARLVGDLVRVPGRPSDPPFLVYGAPELEMGFYEIKPEAVREAASKLQKPAPNH